MDNSRPTLETRTLAFSKEVLNFCKSQKLTEITRPLISQLVRAATSIGANYAEANNASSKADFRNKIFIAKKEAAETKYWLELLAEVIEDKSLCRKLWQECHYILMTLQKVISTLKNGNTVNGESTVKGKGSTVNDL